MSEETKISLQEYADVALEPEYRQPLKTAQEVVAIHGWRSTTTPWCCDVELYFMAANGIPFFAECDTCGKWAWSVKGPTLAGPNTGRFLDPAKVDLDTDAKWIVGVGDSRLKNESARSEAKE